MEEYGLEESCHALMFFGGSVSLSKLRQKVAVDLISFGELAHIREWEPLAPVLLKVLLQPSAGVLHTCATWNGIGEAGKISPASETGNRS